MTLYELSSDAADVREGERVVSLAGRGFPTLVMRWDSRLFDQPWVTTIVLDYVIALPPLLTGQAKFNEVRIAAFVAGAPTKFLYFGTELNASVPRVPPEMENLIGSAGVYQEFRLEEHTCPIPYLKLIQTTPRIFGNGAQDYYSPPIRVERYDGAATPAHIADAFSQVVANLDGVSGSILTDPSQGFWTGARFVGTTAIAIKRQGKVVGLHKRVGRSDKDAMPAVVAKRDPHLDLRQGWVAVDFGARSTVVALRSERGMPELVRIGATSPPVVSADFETPSEIGFEHLGRTLKAWRDRVVLPMTRWEDLVVGRAARERRATANDERPMRAASTITDLPLVRERTERREAFKLRGGSDTETNEGLKRPAPPIIDEDGIGAHDPFDPIELFAYYIGVHVNQRARGLYTRYAVSMPTGWSHERRESVLIAFRRGFYRSLPAGLVAYDDLARLHVIDAGPAAIPFVVQAFRAFGIQPKGEIIPFLVIDAGASETGVLAGLLREAKSDERDDGIDRVIEHLEPQSIPWFGGERLLHRMAFAVYVANEAAMREARVPFELPIHGEPVEGAEELFAPSVEGRTNVLLFRDALRPMLEEGSTRAPSSVRLLSLEGRARDVSVEVDRPALQKIIEGAIGDAVTESRRMLGDALARIGRDPDPFDGLHVFLGGRLGMSERLYDALAADLPANVKLHRFVEPGPSNLTALTVRTATALGVLAMRFDKVVAIKRGETRDAFRYRVGRARHGELADVLDPAVDYDMWREVGACPRPDVEVLFMLATDDGEVAADDPRVMRAVCSLGPDAVGQRLYLRAVASTQVEVSVGPSGAEPASGAPRWTIDLKTSLAGPSS